MGPPLSWSNVIGPLSDAAIQRQECDDLQCGEPKGPCDGQGAVSLLLPSPGDYDSVHALAASMQEEYV